MVMVQVQVMVQMPVQVQMQVLASPSKKNALPSLTLMTTKSLLSPLEIVRTTSSSSSARKRLEESLGYVCFCRFR